MVSKLPPPGQPGRLMEGKGTRRNNVFLPRATSDWETATCQMRKISLDSSCIEGSMRQSRLALGRGSVAPRVAD